MEYIVQTRDLCKTFGTHTAVDHVSMTIHRGDIYGLIGENGAGKTTFMRMVCGLAAPTGGSITLFGSGDLERQRRRMGCTIESTALYPAMTAAENLEVYRRLLGLVDQRVIPELLEFVGLHDVRRKKAKDFSLGMKQRLMIAIALMGNPELLILDEPMNGLDPMGIREVRNLLLELNRERGLTIVVSSHILDELSKIATRYGVIHQGKLIDEFSRHELERRCCRELRLTVSDPERAVSLLREQAGLTPEALPNGDIVLHDGLDQAAEINALLFRGQVEVSALIPREQELEDYFMSLMRGDVA